jgi:hypothetical protein
MNLIKKLKAFFSATHPDAERVAFLENNGLLIKRGGLLWFVGSPGGYTIGEPSTDWRIAVDNARAVYRLVETHD